MTGADFALRSVICIDYYVIGEKDEDGTWILSKNE